MNKVIFIVRSLECIEEATEQYIYGVFESEDDAIKCFEKVLENEIEGGYFCEGAVFAGQKFNYREDYNIFNENEEGDWWEFEIYSLSLNESYA